SSCGNNKALKRECELFFRVRGFPLRRFRPLLQAVLVTQGRKSRGNLCAVRFRRIARSRIPILIPAGQFGKFLRQKWEELLARSRHEKKHVGGKPTGPCIARRTR